MTPLQGLPNVILTPHIGGSTEEAQERIGSEVARKLVDYSDIGSTVGAVNFPQAFISTRPGGARFAHLHRNLPGVLGRINDVFARARINIAGQMLQTDGDLGYVVIDTDAGLADPDAVLGELAAIEGTVRARLLYERG
ncbi:D-3-phosphoglycerate dehydrogenase [Methylobacterium hispanicum]|uniref:D-3-phosphoglycerate dehydrogenase n=1 Tax=Methylobacterium hispanicum TaxID=270350 RepID=A0AAV4ZNP4_9HYPH|nr:D-3-phosphoglycerate dehydrogenase [Methylobacterium hispanicum]